jgi:hypothetical protein
MTDISRRLEILASECLVREREAAARAERIREQVEGLTVAVDLLLEDPQGQAAWEFLSVEYKHLWALAAKEQAEARRWASRHSYATRGMLPLGPDELSRLDAYPQELQEAAIAAGVAYITTEQVRPLHRDRHPNV